MLNFRKGCRPDLKTLYLFKYFFCFFRVVPETGFKAFCLKLLYFLKFAGNVKDILLKPRNGTRVHETVLLSS